LRGVRYPKRLINSIASDPHNPIRFIDDQRHAIALVSRDFPVHEEILQFLLAVEPDRAKSVAGTPIADGPTAPAQVAAHQRDRPVARYCTLRYRTLGDWRSRFCRNGPARSLPQG
jgi:hypothetical protein